MKWMNEWINYWIYLFLKSTYEKYVVWYIFAVMARYVGKNFSMKQKSTYFERNSTKLISIFRAMEATESNIIYTPDAADDFDDEDLDEDLNI